MAADRLIIMSSGGVLKFKAIIADLNLDGISGFEFALKNFLRQRVFDLLLNRSF